MTAMTLRRLIFLGALLTFVDSCASSVRWPAFISAIETLAILGGEEELVPILTAMAYARECEQPIAASFRPRPSFRYGCFCGAGYPDLTHPSGKNVSALHRSERVKLAVEYYRIKPIDNIDEACQAHDVCWLMRGDGDARCNHFFRQALRAIHSNMSERHSFGSGSWEERCMWLARDMELAFLSQFVEELPDPSFGSPAPIHNLWFLPLGILPHTFDWVIPPYPLPNERCAVSE